MEEVTRVHSGGRVREAEERKRSFRLSTSKQLHWLETTYLDFLVREYDSEHMQDAELRFTFKLFSFPPCTLIKCSDVIVLTVFALLGQATVMNNLCWVLSEL